MEIKMENILDSFKVQPTVLNENGFALVCTNNKDEEVFNVRDSDVGKLKERLKNEFSSEVSALVEEGIEIVSSHLGDCIATIEYKGKGTLNKFYILRIVAC